MPPANTPTAGAQCACIRKAGRPGNINSFVSGAMTNQAATYAPTAMKLTCPKDNTPELPMKMYDPTTTNSLIKASMATRCVPGGQMATMPAVPISSKASANSGVSEINRACKPMDRITRVPSVRVRRSDPVAEATAPGKPMRTTRLP